MYLLLLSRLNFDLPVALLLLPDSKGQGHWTDPQWQALSMYGLSSCHHMDATPPIPSQAVTTAQAIELLHPNQAPSMHICHWRADLAVADWLSLAEANDQLLIYGAIPTDRFITIQRQWPNPHCHIVFDGTHPHIADSIDTKTAAMQCLQYTNTLNWQ